MDNRDESPFATPSFKANPYPFFQAPIAKTRLPDGTEVYVVSRYEDVQAGLKDDRLIKNIHNARADPDVGMTRIMNDTSMLNCLGAPLARLEGEIAITTLLTRLPNLRLAIAPGDVIWRPAIELRGLQSLPVTF